MLPCARYCRNIFLCDADEVLIDGKGLRACKLLLATGVSIFGEHAI